MHEKDSERRTQIIIQILLKSIMATSCHTFHNPILTLFPKGSNNICKTNLTNSMSNLSSGYTRSCNKIISLAKRMKYSHHN